MTLSETLTEILIFVGGGACGVLGTIAAGLAYVARDHAQRWRER